MASTSEHDESERSSFSKLYKLLSNRMLCFEKESQAIFLWHLIDQAKKNKLYPHALNYLYQVVEFQARPQHLAVLVRKLFGSVGAGLHLLKFQDTVIADFEEEFNPNLSTAEIWRECRTQELEFQRRLTAERIETERLIQLRKDRMKIFEEAKQEAKAKGDELRVTRPRAPFLRTRKTPPQDSESILDLKITSFADIFLTTQALFLFDDEASHYVHASLVIEKMCANVTAKEKEASSLDENKLKRLLDDYLYWLIECRKSFRVHELCVMLTTTVTGAISKFNKVYFAAQKMCAEEDRYGKFPILRCGRKKTVHPPTEFSLRDHGGKRCMAILAYESYIKLIADFRVLQEQVSKKNIVAHNVSTIPPPLPPPTLEEVEIPSILCGIQQYMSSNLASTKKITTKKALKGKSGDKSNSSKNNEKVKPPSRGKVIKSATPPKEVYKESLLIADNQKHEVNQEVKTPPNRIHHQKTFSLRPSPTIHGDVPSGAGQQLLSATKNGLSSQDPISRIAEQLAQDPRGLSESPAPSSRVFSAKDSLPDRFVVSGNPMAERTAVFDGEIGKLLGSLAKTNAPDPYGFDALIPDDPIPDAFKSMSEKTNEEVQDLKEGLRIEQGVLNERHPSENYIERATREASKSLRQEPETANAEEDADVPPGHQEDADVPPEPQEDADVPPGPQEDAHVPPEPRDLNTVESGQRQEAQGHLAQQVETNRNNEKEFDISGEQDFVEWNETNGKNLSSSEREPLSQVAIDAIEQGLAQPPQIDGDGPFNLSHTVGLEGGMPKISYPPDLFDELLLDDPHPVFDAPDKDSQKANVIYEDELPALPYKGDSFQDFNEYFRNGELPERHIDFREGSRQEISHQETAEDDSQQGSHAVDGDKAKDTGQGDADTIFAALAKTTEYFVDSDKLKDEVDGEAENDVQQEETVEEKPKSPDEDGWNDFANFEIDMDGLEELDVFDENTLDSDFASGDQ